MIICIQDFQILLIYIFSTQAKEIEDFSWEKSMIDDELYNFLANGKSVKNFNCNLDYKGNSIVPSRIIITAIVDGTDYKKIVEIW